MNDGGGCCDVLENPVGCVGTGYDIFSRRANFAFCCLRKCLHVRNASNATRTIPTAAQTPAMIGVLELELVCVPATLSLLELLLFVLLDKSVACELPAVLEPVDDEDPENGGEPGAEIARASVL